ncbi:[2Fe2S]-binding, putative [Acanthamoeba castellanii str. Neff]|uniref:[2Fe2S]-binding, putative n=1 Tax=Acanthamoeba castellanii (strain ATCC 30010 / Neff) TaxID=1257118 RepID=L8H1P6_ACACF|nr:[2Fe2S]-binding, putative [Acanthamoeba castellanii str. Neff]ELR18311.1 [2Fe2S]-binding, putative [Acanthamoeba castellanii str. Neff]
MEEEKVVVAKRTGQVLYKGTILKADHWLGGHQKSPVPFRLSGAPNFRTVPALPVSGVAQPSLFGIRAVLNRVFGRPNRIEQVVWCNLREEPVIYINARPFVLREFDHPFSNLTAYKGMSLSNLEDMEERLKADILAEASRYQGNLLIHDELDDECACPMWEAISSESVMTPREVFFTLQNEGYRVSYWRIPMNAEHFASHEAIDTFVDMVKSIDDQTHFVFNCQMGKIRKSRARARRGRSTMCTVMASLMYMWCRLVNKPLAYRAEDDTEHEAKLEEDILTSGEKKARPDEKQFWFKWELVMVFDRKMNDMLSSSLKVTELHFDEGLNPALRETLRTILNNGNMVIE